MKAINTTLDPVLVSGEISTYGPPRSERIRPPIQVLRVGDVAPDVAGSPWRVTYRVSPEEATRYLAESTTQLKLDGAMSSDD